MAIIEKMPYLVNLYADELFVSIFYSFEAGIANAISSFKRMKIILFIRNRHLKNIII